MVPTWAGAAGRLSRLAASVSADRGRSLSPVSCRVAGVLLGGTRFLARLLRRAGRRVVPADVSGGGVAVDAGFAGLASAVAVAVEAGPAVSDRPVLGRFLNFRFGRRLPAGLGDPFADGDAASGGADGVGSGGRVGFGSPARSSRTGRSATGVDVVSVEALRFLCVAPRLRVLDTFLRGGVGWLTVVVTVSNAIALFDGGFGGSHVARRFPAGRRFPPAGPIRRQSRTA